MCFKGSGELKTHTLHLTPLAFNIYRLCRRHIGNIGHLRVSVCFTHEREMKADTQRAFHKEVQVLMP